MAGGEKLASLRPMLPSDYVQMPRKVAPSGLPTCLRLALGDVDPPESVSASEVLRRKSCVTAIPILANESDVRSQARNVRSTQAVR